MAALQPYPYSLTAITKRPTSISPNPRSHIQKALEVISTKKRRPYSQSLTVKSTKLHIHTQKSLQQFQEGPPPTYKEPGSQVPCALQPNPKSPKPHQYVAAKNIRNQQPCTKSGLQAYPKGPTSVSQPFKEASKLFPKDLTSISK